MENDFSHVCFGDAIFHIRYGWGIAKCIEGRTFRVKFTNINHAEYFFFDGKTSGSDINPSIFWDEIKIIPPLKPKRKIEKTIERWLNFYEDEDGQSYYFSYETKQFADENADKKCRLGEACHVIHKYTIEE